MCADFRQFYMLQKEALTYFLSSLFASAFAIKVVSSTQIFKIIRKYFSMNFSDLCNMSQKIFLAFAIVLCIQQVKNPQKIRLKRKTCSSWQAVGRPQQGEAGQPEPESEPEPGKGAGNLLQQVTTQWWI